MVVISQSQEKILDLMRSHDRFPKTFRDINEISLFFMRSYFYFTFWDVTFLNLIRSHEDLIMRLGRKQFKTEISMWDLFSFRLKEISLWDLRFKCWYIMRSLHIFFRKYFSQKSRYEMGPISKNGKPFY